MRWLWIFILIIIVVAIVVLVRPRDADVDDDDVVADVVVQPISIPVIVPTTDPRLVQLDERFSISGTGSPTDPYRVSWPLMQSAHDVNAPNGEVRVEKYLAQLDGTSIEISGYLAPPVQQETTSELLVMQKRWDGCCIGAPPTPFDCIEVRLDKPITMRGRHLILYGTVRGTLRIEPFTAGKYLLGLYRMENGRVEGEIDQ